MQETADLIRDGTRLSLRVHLICMCFASLFRDGTCIRIGGRHGAAPLPLKIAPSRCALVGGRAGRDAGVDCGRAHNEGNICALHRIAEAYAGPLVLHRGRAAEFRALVRRERLLVPPCASGWCWVALRCGWRLPRMGLGRAWRIRSRTIWSCCNRLRSPARAVSRNGPCRLRWRRMRWA